MRLFSLDKFASTTSIQGIRSIVIKQNTDWFYVENRICLGAGCDICASSYTTNVVALILSR
jgi:hypothetical protein